MENKATYDSRDIICPKCGYRDRDAWDANFGCMEGTIDDYECGNCGAALVVTRSVSVTYEARLLESQEATND